MWLSKIGKSFLNLVYPSQCLHCHQEMETDYLFCAECLGLLVLLDPVERCTSCFSELRRLENSVCQDCRLGRSFLYRTAAAFDYFGPAASLIKHLKYANRPYLAKGAGAYLVAQWVRLEWPMPDVIVSVPIPFLRWMDRGYNQCSLIANVVGEALDRPVCQILRRSHGDYSQAGLNKEQRKKLTTKNFSLKKSVDIRDKCILLIDDVMTTGTTLQQCAEVLMEGYPATIYGLTVCRAID